ncbi:MAG TPA: molybdopterin-dependent oxidoreductase, partial [Nitriliruptorales bacterium]
LRRLLDLAARGTAPPAEFAPAAAQVADAPRDRARRRFVAALAGAGAFAVVAGAIGRMRLTSTTGTRPPGSVLPDPVRRVPTPGSAQMLDVPDITPIVVPNDDFYRIDTALIVPRVDPETWTLRIHGMVERELTLTLDDLYAREQVERHVTLACVSNDVGDDLVGNALWQGVRLAPLLDEAGVAAGAGQVVGRAVDGWTAGFPTELVSDGRDPLVAIGMNGEPLPTDHGYPARLIVPGLYGYVSATKWLSEIELTTWDGFDAYWVPRGWAKEGPIKLQSRIDVPRGGAQVAAGEAVVAGIAWSGLDGISAVEVAVDDGPWLPAALSEPLSDSAWVQWKLTVALDPGRRRLEVRATDASGMVQTDERTSPRPDGATGHHSVTVGVA